jgi:molybdopterin synthase catalytic subunit
MFLTDQPVDVATLARSVMRESDGACVTFEGAVRNHHQGKAVVSIFYDAYRPMAEKELGLIVNALRTEFPDVAIALQHRLGELMVGDVSIAIACSSPHRAEAFTACRQLIDRIKQTVPIWKKERGPDGEEWVGWCHHGDGSQS